MAHLNSLVSMGDSRPTTQMYDVLDELNTLIDIELNKFKMIKEADIKSLNLLIKENIDNFIKY
jgi:hypothetical protein